MFKEKGKRMKKIRTHQDILEEILASQPCFHACLVLKSSIPTYPLPAPCLWALAPAALETPWKSLVRLDILICSKCSAAAARPALHFWSLSPPQGSQDNSICCCQGKGCQAKRSASAEPLALKSSLWFCHALFVAWIHEELLPLPAQLNCTTVGGLNCVFKQAPCCSVSHSFFSFHSNFIYITF